MTQDQDQDTKVGRKYDDLYSRLKDGAEALLAPGSGNGVAKFELLRRSLPALWGLVFENRDLPVREVLPKIDEFNARPCTFYRDGRLIEGTNLSWDEAARDIHVRAVKQHLPSHCDLVMDLGCGWGQRMVDLWLGGGGAREYRGGERSQSGLALVAVLASIFPEMRLSGFAFNFLKPIFPVLETSPSTICVYTYFAIEQVEYLGKALFDALLDQFPKADITGVHVEPFGFQALGADHPSLANDRTYALEHRYNLDLFEQVLRHPRLKIVDAETGLLSSGRGNTAGVLVWRRNG